MNKNRALPLKSCSNRRMREKITRYIKIYALCGAFTVSNRCVCPWQGVSCSQGWKFRSNPFLNTDFVKISIKGEYLKTLYLILAQQKFRNFFYFFIVVLANFDQLTIYK